MCVGPSTIDVPPARSLLRASIAPILQFEARFQIASPQRSGRHRGKSVADEHEFILERARQYRYNAERKTRIVMENSQEKITRLLEAWGSGDQSALGTLVPLVHQELRRLAHRHVRAERPGLGLQTTELVNEVYLKLVDSSRVRWQDRAHFFSIAAQLMRRILADSARSRQRAKRGGGALRVTFEEDLPVAGPDGLDWLELDKALEALAALDPRKCRMVELRFFGGLSVDETAEVLRISPATVQREWRFAKTWLHRELSRGATK